MERRLVSDADAIPRARQHTKPCGDCPWTRRALPGWLGSGTPEEWIELAHGEVKEPCHTVGNQQCAGLAIFRANVFKTPRYPGTLQLPQDTHRVFASNEEFLAHHTLKSISKKED